VKLQICNNGIVQGGFESVSLELTACYNSVLLLGDSVTSTTDAVAAL